MTGRRLIDFFWGPADPRAYALVRIGLAIGGLLNLADLWPNRFEFYASTGMVPLGAVHEAMRGIRYPSVFDYGDSEAATTAFFVVAALALLALGLGIFPRLAAALVYVWHLSASHRTPPILHGWDHILRAYSLLVLVSPMPRVWTVWRGRRPASVPAYGLRMMQWQLAVIYLVTVWEKMPDPYWRNGQLLAYFSVSLFSRAPDTLFLVRHEWASALATYASLAIEASIPWLLWSRRTRVVGLLGGIVLHVLVAATARITIFSTCILVPYAAFLESAEIDWFSALVRARSPREVIDVLVAGRYAAPSGASGTKGPDVEGRAL